MARAWKFQLIRPTNTIEIFVKQAWALMLQDLEKWMRTKLIHALVYGGLGIDGIKDSEFYQFVSSNRGLSELGIEKKDATKLLKAYQDTFKVSRNKRILTMKFGDHMALKLATPHPHAGVKHLHVESWMEFVLDGVKANSGFVPRGKLPKEARKAIRVRSAGGGLMLPQGVAGSTGSWHFPLQLSKYYQKWFNSNVAAIEEAIANAIADLLTKRMS